MHKNSHSHITPSRYAPAVKQNLNYSISAFAIGPSGHLAISSVISLSGLIRTAEELCSQNQPLTQEHITAAVYPPIRTQPLHPYTQEEAGLKLRGGHRRTCTAVEQHVGWWICHSNCFKAWDGLSSLQEAEVVVQENSMPIKSYLMVRLAIREKILTMMSASASKPRTGRTIFHKFCSKLQFKTARSGCVNKETKKKAAIP